ncbi:replication initiation and membrane attachment family protein [Solibacillus merdavium]|uniref:DnaD domain protein n=1 Tax=Solibacillus merdavium TaxID=2762218 RepID=A0ABR8XK41_9BACL|nr:DnaD domain protein [Solibacillus merdavium]MBD8032278.1 DnaD domain protein [Solibacillus merdavium]
MVHFKEIQPTDHFEITLPHALSTNERQLLTLFYQPLTGPEPISLFLTLWAEAENHTPQQYNHYYLMHVLSMPLKKIFEARIALEAIGLMRTWRKDTANERYFIYELVRPLDAPSFFKDPLLSMFLFSKIGEGAYRKLRQRFLTQPNKEQYEEVTRTFMDVYRPINQNLPQDELETMTPKQSDYPFYYEQFDFKLLQAGLSEQLIPSAALTVKARETIAKLAFLYHLTPLQMQKVVIQALDEQNKLTTERLKRCAADYYKLTVSTEAPVMTKVFDAKNNDTLHAENLTKEQELLHYLETTPPVQVLRDINNGKEPIPSSIQLAEDLVVKYSMPIGVANVLLEYVMLSTDMKLPKSYVEKIADHWNRKQLKTAKEAMDLAREERDKYTKWKQESSVVKQPANSQKKPSYNRKSGRDEQVPDWFYKRNEQQQPEKDSAVDFEQERLKILQKLDRAGE